MPTPADKPKVQRNKTTSVQAWFAALDNHTDWEYLEDSLRSELSNAVGDKTLQHKLGKVCLKARKINDALYYLRAASRSSADFDVWNDLGRALNNARDFPGAETAFRRALSLAPDFAEAYDNLGHVLRAQSRFESAQKAFQMAIQREPNRHRAHFNLATVYLAQYQARNALESFRHATSLAPQLPHYWSHRGLAAQHVGYAREARHCFEQSVNAEPSNPDNWCNLGSACQSLGDMETARQCFDNALVQAPGYEPALTGLAGLLHAEHRSEEALEILRPLISEAEPAPMSLMAYAQLVKGRLEADSILDKIDVALRSGRVAKEQQAHLLFTTADILHTQKKYAEAFERYEQANKEYGARFDIEVLAKRTRWLVYLSRHLKEYKRSNNESDRPIFVVGMPRSGTTLVQQVIAAHPEMAGAGELRELALLSNKLMTGHEHDAVGYLHDIDTNTLDAAAAEYLGTLAAADENARRVVDKMWQNFEYLVFAQLLFPRSRVIICRRNPLDVALSCFQQSFGVAGPPFSYDLQHIAAYFAHFEKVVESWLSNTDHEYMEVVYESFVDDFEDSAKRLIEFTGKSWHPDVLRFHEKASGVRTASYEQVRKPIYQNAVHRHRHYDAQLGELRHWLQEYGVNYS